MQSECLLWVLAGGVFALFAHSVPALEQGENVMGLPVGTLLPHLVLLGWNSVASLGLFSAVVCVHLWNGLTGRWWALLWSQASSPTSLANVGMRSALDCGNPEK
jgi:hypothetical protein